MPRPVPAALTVSRIVLRILLILNWVYGAIIFAILVGMFTAAPWTLMALGFRASAEPGPLIEGVRIITVLGLVGVPLNFIVLAKLLAIVDTVRGGDPFVAQNAARLQTIAWAVLGQQLLQLMVGMLPMVVPSLSHSLHVDAVSPSGWLAVVLLFVLARVFADGTGMRADLEGTI